MKIACLVIAVFSAVALVRADAYAEYVYQEWSNRRCGGKLLAEYGHAFRGCADFGKNYGRFMSEDGKTITVFKWPKANNPDQCLHVSAALQERYTFKVCKRNGARSRMVTMAPLYQVKLFENEQCAGVPQKEKALYPKYTMTGPSSCLHVEKRSLNEESVLKVTVSLKDKYGRECNWRNSTVYSVTLGKCAPLAAGTSVLVDTEH